MQEPKKPEAAPPLVLHIRISGRWMPVLSAVSIFALLPALSASAPLAEGAPQTLSARSTRALAVDLAGAAADTVAASAARLGQTTGLAYAVGGGAIDFPSISMSTSVAAGIGAARGIALAPASFARAPGFIMPISGPVMSVFGPRRHPVLGVPMFHTGIDLGASCGTPIRAAADGVVAYAGVTPSWGQRIIIEHDTQLKTGYAHMSQMIAKEGDVVRQGDVIGLVGTTGWSTGCHLHFDVILNERYVDPRPYIGLGPAAAVSIPYTAAPYRVTDTRGTVVYTVEDGDVPIPPESNGSTTPVVTKPTTTVPTTTTPSTTTPTTTTPTTTDPTTSTPPTTTDPTTSTPPTTTDPTTSTPPTTTDPATTAPPPDPTTDPTTTEPPADPTTTTTEPAPAPTATEEPTATEPPPTATATEPAPAPTTTSEPAPTSDSTATSTTPTAPAAADDATSEATTPPG